jgi:hypothetical protein
MSWKMKEEMPHPIGIDLIKANLLTFVIQPNLRPL